LQRYNYKADSSLRYAPFGMTFASTKKNSYLRRVKEYQNFLDDTKIKKVKAMKSSK